jgi:predicted RNase H-like HicB family nuclease
MDGHYLGIMKLRLLIELDPATKRWSAVFPELPGCASAGDTEAEAIANAKEAWHFGLNPAPSKSAKTPSWWNSPFHESAVSSLQRQGSYQSFAPA